MDYQFTGKWCHAGGRDGGHFNYGWPCVTGFVDMGRAQVIATNCVFCGKDCSSDFPSSVFSAQTKESYA